MARHAHGCLTTRTELVRDYSRIQHEVREKARVSRQRILELLRPDVLRMSSWTPVALSHAFEFYKVVAAKDGRLLSIYDGETEYQLGRWTLAKHGAASWPPTYACFFGYQEAGKALEAKFSEQCVLGTAPRVLLRLQAQGRAYHHAKSGTWAFSRVRPLELIAQQQQQQQQLAPKTAQHSLQTVSSHLRCSSPTQAQLNSNATGRASVSCRTSSPEKADGGECLEATSSPLSASK